MNLGHLESPHVWPGRERSRKEWFWPAHEPELEKSRFNRRIPGKPHRTFDALEEEAKRQIRELRAQY